METGLAASVCSSPARPAGSAAACARPFIAEGARVVAPLPPRARAGAGARSRGGGRARPTCRRGARSSGCSSEAGALDVCAAVAGVWPAEDVPVWELPLERWEETLRANLTATFLTARGVPARGGGAGPRLAGAGRLDRRARSARPGTPTTRRRSRRSPRASCSSLKNEVVRVAPRARVNAVAPGWTESPMTRGTSTTETVRRITRTMALGRSPSPRTSRRRWSCSPRTCSPAT